jgi:hypothetical protein
MSVDYRLLNHFRVSQRREMAARGVVAAVVSVTADSHGETPERRARAATPAQKPLQPIERPDQVLTHLLNEDR